MNNVHGKTRIKTNKQFGQEKQKKIISTYKTFTIDTNFFFNEKTEQVLIML